MLLSDFQTAVKYYIGFTTGDTSNPDVDQAISDTVRDLSRIIMTHEVDTSGTSTANQSSIVFPTGAVAIERLEVNGLDIEYTGLDFVDINETNNIQKYYIRNNVIYLTSPLVAGLPIKIFYKKSLVAPTVSVNYSGSDDTVELVILGAVYRYFKRFFSLVSIKREKYPDVTPNEILLAYQEFARNYKVALENYVQSHKYLGNSRPPLKGGSTDVSQSGYILNRKKY